MATSTSGVGRSRRRRALVAAFLLAAAGLFVAHWLPKAGHYYSMRQMVQSGPSRPQYDFFQYYSAGNNWRLGLDPYAPVVSGPGAMPIPRSGSVSGFIYPPAILPLLGELSGLDYERARVVWLGVCLSMMLLPLALGVALARDRRWEVAALGALLFAASDPVLFHIRQGQIDMIVAGLAVTAFLLYGRLRSWPSAVLFAVAIAIKLTPAVLVLALVAYRRDWPLLLKTMTAGLAVIALSLLVVQPHLYADYITTVLPSASGGNPFFHNQSLLRGWSHLDVWAKYASLGGYALVVAAAAVAGRGLRPAGPTDAGRSAITSPMLQLQALAVMGILLFSPLSWRMAFVWAVVPMALVLAGASWTGRCLHYALVAAAAALMCLPVWDRPVLDSLETIGAAVAATGLLAALLVGRPAGPELDQRRLSTQRA